MVFVIHVFTVAYFYCCYSPGVEPWLPNCEGFDINGTCLLLVPLSICYFFSFKSFTLKIDSGVYSRQPGNHYKKGFGNSRLEDFNSGKIMLTRYYIDWQIHLVWMIIERMTNLVYCIYKEDITCILEVFFLVYWKRRCDIDPDLFYFIFSPYCGTLSESPLLCTPTAEEVMFISTCSLLHLLQVCSTLNSHLVLTVHLLLLL